MKQHLVMFAAYNAWANRRLYACAGNLSESDYRADRGAFFGSLHGTLNHLLLGDRLWMHRFTGEGPSYPALDLILFDDLAPLAEARVAEDARISAFVEGLGEADLDRSFTYTPITDPRELTQRYGPALAHFFNHQTHHRGQAHALLTAAGGRAAATSLDMIQFQRETGIGLA